VVQNERTPGSLFKFVIQQQFEIRQNNAKNYLSSELATYKVHI